MCRCRSDGYNLRQLQPFKSEEPFVEVRKSSVCEGWGLWSTIAFREGEIICRYSGVCIDHQTAQHSQSQYILGPVSSSYVQIRKKTILKHWYIDSESKQNTSGRFVNHDERDPNCIWDFPNNPDRMLYDQSIGRWYVYIKAAYDIQSGTELTIDYGFDLDNISDPYTGKLINDFEYDLNKIS